MSQSAGKLLNEPLRQEIKTRGRGRDGERRGAGEEKELSE